MPSLSLPLSLSSSLAKASFASAGCDAPQIPQTFSNLELINVHALHAQLPLSTMSPGSPSNDPSFFFFPSFFSSSSSSFFLFSSFSFSFSFFSFSFSSSTVVGAPHFICSDCSLSSCARAFRSRVCSISAKWARILAAVPTSLKTKRLDQNASRVGDRSRSVSAMVMATRLLGGAHLPVSGLVDIGSSACIAVPDAGCKAVAWTKGEVIASRRRHESGASEAGAALSLVPDRDGRNM